MNLITTSNLKSGFVKNYVSPTSGMPISLQDFQNHHLTSESAVVGDLPTSNDGFLVALPVSTEVIKNVGQGGGLITAIGAWSEYENIEDFINEIYKTREKSKDRLIDL